MVLEAEEFAEEDKQLKDHQVDARNGLESYIFNLKSQLEGENGLSDKLSQEDFLDELNSLIEETIDWVESNPEAEKAEIDEKQHHVKSIFDPVMRDFYSGNMDDEENDIYGDDEL